MNLSGRTTLITGASSGLGARFARVLADAGANVVIGARRLERVEAIARDIGDQAFGVMMDVTDEVSVMAAYDSAEARFGPVDAIVANAGVGTGGRSTDVPADGLRQVIDTNLLGTYLTVREGARRMIAAGSRDKENGRVVLIGSITARRNAMGDAAYAATKAGISRLAGEFAREWVRQGINVNCLEPGIIPTDANADWFAGARGQAEVTALPRRRLLQPDALDDMLLYLLSDRARQVTGATFTIDDGQSL